MLAWGHEEEGVAALTGLAPPSGPAAATAAAAAAAGATPCLVSARRPGRVN